MPCRRSGDAARNRRAEPGGHGRCNPAAAQTGLTGQPVGGEEIVSVTVSVVIVVICAFGLRQGARLLQDRGLLLAGTEYMLLGMAVGPLGAGVLSGDRMLVLQPVLSLALGLLGFLLGLSLRRRFDSGWAAPGLLSAALVSGLVGGAALLALPLLPADTSAGRPRLLALVLAAMAAVSSHRALVRVSEHFGARGPVGLALQVFARTSVIVAIAVFGITLAVARAQSVLELSRVEWILAATAAGVGCGVLYRVFVGARDHDDRTFLATIAIVVFSSGLAAGMGMSPLFVNAVAGLTLALLSAQAETLSLQLARLEGPTRVTVFVLAGAMWIPPSGWAWLLPVGYVVCRLFALRLAPALALTSLGSGTTLPGVGRAMLAQGVLTVAIAVNLAQVAPALGPVALTAALFGLLATDALGRYTIHGLLADSGEIVHADLLTVPIADASSGETEP